ncbi:hypothetical protein BD410DRAFT_531915 [Rickenella mellea]|uniref:Uncharacterized protein n=1 Tax=Rickenella mellea TaxID=50990 RepID=A0A4Y7QH90_9AGAM|nr:hypothetical protein BD410DRAFT_531915 [Rickenella mellea]
MESQPPNRCGHRTTIECFKSRELPDKFQRCYPFIRQIDVLVENSDQEAKLKPLVSNYERGKLRLSDLLDCAQTTTTTSYSNLLVVTTGVYGTEDVWCLDSRGLFILALTKESYEILGIVGAVMGNHKKSEYFHVQVDSRDRSAKVFERSKQAIERWEKQRFQNGHNGWDAIYHTTKPAALPFQRVEHTSHSAVCELTVLNDINIPKTSIESPPKMHKPPQPIDKDMLQDWNDSVSALFEWVGMACLGSQRLKANDSVDPYVGIYETPSPSRVGTLKHLRWRGLLPPAFAQMIIKAISNSDSQTSDFVAITMNMFTSSPVTYIPPNAFSDSSDGHGTSNQAVKSVSCWSAVAGQAAWIAAVDEC